MYRKIFKYFEKIEEIKKKKKQFLKKFPKI